MTTTLDMPVVEGVDHTFVELSDGRMHVAAMGSGEPVLLLSGFAQTWWEWRTLMPALAADGYRAIAVDLRGEGWSELPFDAITRTRRAQDIIALLDVLELNSVRLVSHDMGAISAIQLTLEHPERFSAQVILAVPPPQMRFSLDLVPGMRHLWHQEVLAIPGLGPALLREGHLPRHLFTQFSSPVFDPAAVATYVLLLRDAELSKAAAPLCRRMVLPELVRIVRGAYREQRFARPVLFVFGAADIGFPPHVARRLFEDTAAIGADARLALIDHAGHYVVDEAPDSTATQVLEFFAET